MMRSIPTLGANAHSRINTAISSITARSRFSVITEEPELYSNTTFANSYQDYQRVGKYSVAQNDINQGRNRNSECVISSREGEEEEPYRPATAFSAITYSSSINTHYTDSAAVFRNKSTSTPHFSSDSYANSCCSCSPPPRSASFTMIMKPVRTLSLGTMRRPSFFRSSRTPSTTSTNSLPGTVVTSSTASSRMSERSRKLFAKVPKIFDFEMPYFGATVRLHRERAGKVGKVGHGLLTKRHKKPSTLDFRCIGMAGEDEFYFRGSMTALPPRIQWRQPDIHSDWKKDWFIGVC